MTRMCSNPAVANQEFDHLQGSMNVVSKKIFDSYFLLSEIIDVEGVKTTLKIGSAKHFVKYLENY